MKKFISILLIISMLFVLLSCEKEKIEPTASPVATISDSSDNNSSDSGESLSGNEGKTDSTFKPINTPETEKNPEPTTGPGSVQIKPEGEITVSYNVSYLNNQKNMDAYIAAFNKMYPDVKVIKDYAPGDIKSRMASRTIGDVVFLQDTELYDYAVYDEMLLHLNQHISPLKMDISDMQKNVIESCLFNEKIYMVPAEYNKMVMIYNKTALKNAGLKIPENGWTWEEFSTYCEKLTQKQGDKYTQVGGLLNYMSSNVVTSLIKSWGIDWYDSENKKVEMNDDKIRKGLEEVLALANSGYIKPEGKDDLSAYNKLSDTDYVFRVISYSELEKYSKQYESKNLEWDIVTFPIYTKASKEIVTGVKVSGFSVYKYSKNPNAAAAFALFLTTEEGQKAFYGNQSILVPTNKQVAKSDIWYSVKNKNMDAFTCSTTDMYTPNMNVSSRVGNAFSNSWQAAISDYYKTGSVKSALNDGESLCKQMQQRVEAAKK